MSTRRRFKTVAGLVIYALYILWGYYEEKVLTRAIKKRTLTEDLTLISLQCAGFAAIAFLFVLLPRQSLAQRLFAATGLGDALDRIFGKQAGAPSMPPASPHALRKKFAFKTRPAVKRNKRQATVCEVESPLAKGLKVCLIVCVLSLINIASKASAYRSLDHTNYLLMLVVRSFRLLPVAVSRMLSERRTDLHFAKSQISALTVIFGTFIFVFGREEREENLEILLSRKDLFRAEKFNDKRKRKLARGLLKFMSYKLSGSLDFSAEAQGAQEAAFMQGLLARERGEAPSSPSPFLGDSPCHLDITEYRGLLCLYNNVRPPGLSQSTQEVFRILNGPMSPQYRQTISSLVASLLEFISANSSPSLFNTFLEENKLKAGCLLWVYSWTEVCVGGGQKLLSKAYKVDFVLIFFYMNLLSMIMAFAMVYTSFLFSPGPGTFALLMLSHWKKDTLLLVLLNPLAKVLMYRTMAKRGAVTLLSIDIGRKFCSVLLSIVFYGHNFGLSQFAGLLLIFAGFIVDADINHMFLSAGSRNILYRKRDLSH